MSNGKKINFKNSKRIVKPIQKSKKKFYQKNAPSNQELHLTKELKFQDNKKHSRKRVLKLLKTINQQLQYQYKQYNMNYANNCMDFNYDLFN